jgi:hypothetical protein
MEAPAERYIPPHLEALLVNSHRHHFYKSTHQNFHELPQRALRVLLLSGRPAVSRPVELYPIILATYKNYFLNLLSMGLDIVMEER